MALGISSSPRLPEASEPCPMLWLDSPRPIVVLTEAVSSSTIGSRSDSAGRSGNVASVPVRLTKLVVDCCEISTSPVKKAVLSSSRVRSGESACVGDDCMPGS